MRVAELSWRTGVPVPTIKFYLREGLLARGELTSPNQASYGEDHVRRLRLIRALVEVGGLSVAAAREVLTDVDAPLPDLDCRLGRVIGAVNRPPVELDPEDRAAARRRVDALVQEHGWAGSSPDYPARLSLEEVVATLTRLGADEVLANLDRYAELAGRVADVDLDTLVGVSDVDAALEQAVIATVLGDALLACLRRVAQAAESGRRLGPGASVVPPADGAAHPEGRALTGSPGQ